MFPALQRSSFWLAHRATIKIVHHGSFSLKIFNFVICDLCSFSPSLTILVPSWFVIALPVFFYFTKLIFCFYLQSKSIFFILSHPCFRAVFNWVLKLILACFGFALLCSVIGLENSRHHLNQSDAKLKPLTLVTRVFPRFSRLPVFTCSSHISSMMMLTFVLIGYYFGFGF